MAESGDVLFDRMGCVGLIRLNRPKALNALTHAMCLDIHRRLRLWETDDRIKTICIAGEGDRAFCAGGDIRALYESGLAGTAYALQFYADEYQLNRYIKCYPKPYVALFNGITMGGGVGVSVHGSHRVAGEGLLFAMPETGIGLFPDVGGSYFLPRLKGALGMYLALTGERLGCADSCYAGIATNFVPQDRHEAFLKDLAGNSVVDDVLAGYAVQSPEAPIAAQEDDINRYFSFASVEEIISALQAADTDWARRTAKTLLAKSPTSLKITFRQIRDGANLDFDECMRMEYRMVNRVIAGHDFYEGTRAAIIDKDQAPKWKPGRLEQVSKADVAAYFKPLPDDILFD